MSQFELKVNRSFPSPDYINLRLIVDTYIGMIEGSRKLVEKFRPNEIQGKIFLEYLQSKREGNYYYLFYGSTGSGKTMLALLLLTWVLLENPGAKALIVRKTLTQFFDSVMQDIEDFWNSYGIAFHRKLINGMPTYYLPNGSRADCRSEVKSSRSSQEKADDLGSTQYNIVYMNEMDSMSETYFATLPSRTRNRHLVSKPLIIGDCNPPPKDHWIYNQFFIEHNGEDPECEYRAFKLPVTDNITHVLPEYLEDMKAFYASYPSLYKKFVEGDFGPTVKGTAIYKGIFSHDLHIASAPIIPDPKLPLIRGWDFGFHRPAIVIAQDDYAKNEIRVLRTILGSDVLLRRFGNRIIRLCDKLWPGYTWKDYCDPHGEQVKDDGKSSIQILKDIGLMPQAKFKNIDYGLNILEQCLTELSEFKRPVIQIDPDNATLLIEALAYGYTHDPDKLHSGKIVPYKDGTYDHIMDAFRYILIHIRSLTKKGKNKYSSDTEWTRVRTVDNGKYGSAIKNWSNKSGNSLSVGRT